MMMPAKSVHDLILNRHSQLAFRAGLEDNLLRRVDYEISSTTQLCLFILGCSKSKSNTDGQDGGNDKDKKPNSNCTITASGTYPGNLEGLLYLVKDPSSEATSSEQPGHHAACGHRLTPFKSRFSISSDPATSSHTHSRTTLRGIIVYE